MRAAALKSGGTLILQDYLDWGGMKIVPPSDVFDGAVQACMKSWHDGGGRINIAEHIPALATECGLVLEHFRPLARMGKVGSLEWRWLEGFFLGYLPRLVRQNRMSALEFETFKRDWAARAADGSTYCFTPVMADVVLRKP